MERLNDIMGRAAQRRQPHPEPRPTQGIAHPGQRAPQSQQPASRQSLSEQRTQLGQQQPGYVPMRMRPTQQHPQGPAVPENRPYSNPLSHPEGNRGYPQSYNQRQSPMEEKATYQRSRTLRESAPLQPLATHQANDYYTTDDYPASPGNGIHADVIEEWEEEEEEEDDAIGMAYGDWEQDDKEVIVYKRSDVDIIAEPRTPYQPIYRDRPVADVEPPQTRMTRNPHNLREFQIPTTVSTQLPHPGQTRPQEAQRYQQRVTQPLQSQAMAAPTREQRHFTPLETLADLQPVRHIITREESERPMQAPLPTKYVCPRCKGAGYLRANVEYGHPNFGKPIACECKEAERKDKRRQQLRDMSNLDAFYNQGFRTFNAQVPGVREAFQASREFAENPNGWLLLIGPNGCGKTHLAAAIANQSLDDGAVVLFEAVPDLLDHLRAAFAPTATEVFDQLFAKMREAELLVLDDLGAQQSSAWANEKLFQLLNYRYNMSMPTVITANPKGLQGVDERIRSRLSDTGLVTSINLHQAHDFRPRQPKRR